MRDRIALPPISQILPHLYISDARDTRNEDILRDLQISVVVSLLADSLESMLWSRRKFTAYVASTDHLYVQCEDSSTQDLLPHLERICTFVDTRIATQNVIVHCERGISRSPTAVIAYLMWKDKMSRDEALSLVKSHRKIRPNTNFLDQLDVWAQCEYQIWEDEAKIQPKSYYQAHLDRRAERLKELSLTGDEPIGMMWEVKEAFARDDELRRQQHEAGAYGDHEDRGD